MCDLKCLGECGGECNQITGLCGTCTKTKYGSFCNKTCPVTCKAGVYEILENAKCATKDSGENGILKSVQLIEKMGHVRKILGNVSCVKEDSGEANVLTTVQLIVKAVHVFKTPGIASSVRDGFGE